MIRYVIDYKLQTGNSIRLIFWYINQVHKKPIHLYEIHEEVV